MRGPSASAIRLMVRSTECGPSGWLTQAIFPYRPEPGHRNNVNTAAPRWQLAPPQRLLATVITGYFSHICENASAPSHPIAGNIGRPEPLLDGWADGLPVARADR
jgi:hypothetical protein